MTRRSTFLAAVALGVGSALAACSGASSPPDGAASGQITVFAASSLRSVFTDLAERLERDHAGTKVTVSFAGSSDLVTQLVGGAPADVFASADEKNMDKAAEAGLIAGAPAPFARNTLTIVTTPGNPKGINTLADLVRPGTAVVVCAPQVPCGAATEKVEKAAGVTLTPVSEESAVADVLGKVVSGQADAGLVYVTDAEAAGTKVTAIPFPESHDAPNTYPIAVLANAANPALARDFVELVTGPQGRQALSAAGFAVP